MTANQITKKLTAAGITKNVTVRRDEVEVLVTDADGDCDRAATDRLARRVEKAIGVKGGYRCGYGDWVVSARACSIDSGNCR